MFPGFWGNPILCGIAYGLTNDGWSGFCWKRCERFGYK